MEPIVTAFFDESTFTVSYVVADPATACCAIVDPVLDFDAASGRTSARAADRIVAFVRDAALNVEWILETHAHADHLSAAPYLRRELGGKIAIGEYIREVQAVFAGIFNLEPAFISDGSEFDHLFTDGETVAIGELPLKVLHTPGHTPACVTYLVGNVAFIGDTLFMPDFGTARTDFPGGDARTLYRSIQKILDLPAQTRLFMCHDYKAPGREEYRWESSVAEQRAANIHLRQGASEEDFARFRTRRDASLSMPRLLLPSVQVNIRGGELPPPEDNGVSYLKIPLNAL